MERQHVGVDARVVGQYREIMRDNLRQAWREGFHRLAEVTAERLGLELNLPEGSLLERLGVERQEIEEPPENLPLVGVWIPNLMGDQRPSSDITEERVVDGESTAPTLLVDSDGQTVRQGSAFEYWSRITDTLGTFEPMQGQSVNSEAVDDERPPIRFRSRSSENHFESMLSTFRSRTTTIAFPIHPRNITTVQEAVAYDGFRSEVIQPTTRGDLPMIIIARHEAALERASQGFGAGEAREDFNVHGLAASIGWMAIGLAIAVFYYHFR